MKNVDCPFCNFDQPIVRQTNSWNVIPNKFPYERARVHFLITLREHREDWTEISDEEITELFKVSSELNREYGGGAFAFRNGSNEETGTTVKHLHAHYVIRDQSKTEPTYIHVGPLPKRY